METSPASIRPLQKKISYGIALCRYNEQKNKRAEILMIKKRYSYHFFNFVFGRYKPNDTKYLQHLFDNMSFAEKIDIIGMNFENMWYRIWLNNPTKHFDISDVYDYINGNKLTKPKHNMSSADKYKSFFQKKNKFEKNFMGDSGKKLRSIINNSSDAELTWEMPKGGKQDNETNIDCAIREFYEETSIASNKYKILYDVGPIIDTIVEEDTIYQHCYYLAVVREGVNIFPKINFNNFEQISEIEQLRWISIADIEFLKMSRSEHSRLLRLASRVVKFFKKHNKLQRTNLKKNELKI